jgi:hypothetical protein
MITIVKLLPVRVLDLFYAGLFKSDNIVAKYIYSFITVGCSRGIFE